MSKFISGQKWIFKGRECDPNPHFVVIANETINGTPIVHISILGVRIKNSSSGYKYIHYIGHVPVSEAVLFECATHQEGETNIPTGAYEGIESWRRSAGGFFYTIPLNDILIYTEGLVMEPIQNQAQILNCPEYNDEIELCMPNSKLCRCNGNVYSCDFFNVRIVDDKCVLSLTTKIDGEVSEEIISFFYLED